ncbi:hypothetical protein LshimejAT787_0210910 [Lyophyllum shimeji]|uniref:Uncharacterized protein n=1 Tax=Lyophyllum shimeji TaxID=47721 RepID=A0A9P3PGQ5_LYOSH|nr:hypothetical protein LshimejAT787_0210910 [Lyophyllum shimeji]
MAESQTVYHATADETCARKPSTTVKPLTFQKTLYRPPSLRQPAPRFARPYGVHTIRTYDHDESFPGSEDEKDEEPSPELKRPCRSRISSSGSGKPDAPPPRVVLLDLPTEILELIAASLRCQVPVLEAASRYIDDRYSDFSYARFTLSAFSKACSALRSTVERVLYRDVQLDFTGWKGRKHTKWPAASLHLLLRTLDLRPELGHFIHGAALDFQLSSESTALEQGLGKFLQLTPNLKTLLIGQCPLALWDFPLHRATTFATTFAPGILPSILRHFPNLQNLYLRDCHIMSFSVDLPPHNLKAIRFDSNHEHAEAHISRALVVCSDTVRHLDIRFIGGLLHQSPIFMPRIPNIGTATTTNLRSLRLDNISVFSHLDSAYIQILQSLPALEYLHVSNHSSFSPNAFTVLPSCLQELRISDYYGYWERWSMDMKAQNKNEDFMAKLAACITLSTRKIVRVIVSAGSETDESLQLILNACHVEQVQRTEVEGDEAFIEVNFSEA